jgi:Fic-DOC domain mobile mystery protein B
MDFRLDLGNTPLDLSEVEGLIPSLSTMRELNFAETRNIVLADKLARANRRIQTNLLDPEVLKLLHKMMFNEVWRWAGKYRQTQKSIGIEAYRISSELKNLTEDVKTWIEFKTYSRDEIATKFHHRLVLIHAFRNGNGRHARLATDILCQQLGIEPLTWGSKAVIDPKVLRERYISALQKADAHDYSPLMEFVRS